MRAFLVLFTYEFKAGIRNKTSLMMTYLMPIGFYLMMGFIMVGINPGFQEIMIPAMLVFSVMTSTLMGLPTPIVEAREKGVLRSYKVNGIKSLNVIIIPTLTSLVHLLIVATIIIITAPILFSAPHPSNYLAIYFVFIIGSLAFSMIGTLLGIISKDTRVTVLLAQAIYLPSMLIGGLMVPSEMLPNNINTIAKVLPATYFMDSLMHYSYNIKGMGSYAILVLTLTIILGLVLSFLLYSYDKASRRLSVKLASIVLLPYLISVVFLK